MLKFGMTLGENIHGAGLVLEPRNLELLQEGRPMLIDLRDLGLGLVKRRQGKGRILIAYAEQPKTVLEELSRQTGIPVPNPGQAIYTVAEVHMGRCYCAALGSPCVCRG